MTKVGTGYVEIKPDFSAFGAGFDREIKAKLAGIGKTVGGDITKDVSRALGSGTSKVKVDVDRNSLTRMSAAIAGAGAVGFAAIAGAASSAFSSITSAAGGIGGALGNAFGALTSLGPFLTGAAIVLGTLLLPAAIALGASLVTAAAGAAALGAALAAAFGPVALVGLAIITRLALIVKAVATSQKAGTEASRGQSQALAAMSAASEQASAAQANLAVQLKAARQAQIDATEAVKDDKLARDQAREGIVGSRLATRRAIQDLEDFKNKAGAAGNAFAGVFKKFTDVNVDTSGLKNALAAASKASGTALSGDQALGLEEKIHAVREAKLAERAATDNLHDSEVKLSRDRATEADFLQRGAEAYGPYRQAVAQVKTAQRGLKTATDAANAGIVKQRQAFDDLTPAERKFGALLIETGKALKAAFSPAVSASLAGISAAIRAGLAVLKDPKIAESLKGIGRAIGSVFFTLAREIARPEIRDTFVQLANGGARLVRIFGSKVFVALERIFLRIARAALPALVALVVKFSNTLGGLEKGTRNADSLKGKIDTLTDSFGRVIELGHQFGRVLLEVLFGAKGAGDSLIVSLTSIFKNLADGLSKPEGQKKLQDFFQKSADFAKTLGQAIVVAIPIVKGLLNAFVFLARNIRTIGIVLTAVVSLFFPQVRIALLAVALIVTAIKNWRDVLNALKRTVATVAGAFSSAFGAVKGAVSSALNAVVSTISGFYSKVKDVGGHLGRGLTAGIKSGLSGLVGIGKTIINGLIDVLNTGFKAVNDFIPNRIKLPGPVPDINLPDNVLPTIPRLAAGGLTQSATLALLGEKAGQRQEAVLPLENPAVMSKVGLAIARQINRAAPRVGAGTSALAGDGVHIEYTAHIEAKDPDLTALKTRRELERISRESMTAALGSSAR